MKSTSGFSRRGPDIVTEELVAILSKKASYEFKPLFLMVHKNLIARDAASGGEEMLRLRAYEKLQNLVYRGMVSRTVTKTGKMYKGLAAGMATIKAEIKACREQTAIRLSAAQAQTAK